MRFFTLTFFRFRVSFIDSFSQPLTNPWTAFKLVMLLGTIMNSKRTTESLVCYIVSLLLSLTQLWTNLSTHCFAKLHIIKINCLAQPLTFLENIRSENFKTCKMKILGLRPGSGGQLQDRELGYLPPPWVGMIWGWKWNLFNQTYIGKHYSNTKM